MCKSRPIVSLLRDRFPICSKLEEDYDSDRYDDEDVALFSSPRIKEVAVVRRDKEARGTQRVQVEEDIMVRTKSY